MVMRIKKFIKEELSGCKKWEISWLVIACTLPKGYLQVVRTKYLANLLLVG